VKSIAIIACCDTKFNEVSYVREKIADLGYTPMVLDISTRGTVPIKTDYPREEIVKSGSYAWDEIKNAPKDEALAKMSESARSVLVKLQADGIISGVLGMGGLQNTVVCAYAMQALPLGFPKLIVTTVASGQRYFDAVVGESDITTMPSIVDFAGMNAVAEVILMNAASAITGMVEHGGGKIRPLSGWRIGATLMGITNDTVMRAVRILADAGKEVISFHSTGVGGRTMEKMILEGSINAVMDLSLHEMAPEYFNGLGYCGGAFNRLCAAAKMGIPMVVAPGAIDCISLRPGELFPDEEQRGYSWHNKGLTHTRLYEREILDITETIIKRINESKGKVTVLLPLGGLRTLSRPGELFHIPETIKKMRTLFEEKLKPGINFKAVGLNFMDEAFAEIAAKEILTLL
jgi:uncharacterized protein (UPF0261 family)